MLVYTSEPLDARPRGDRAGRDGALRRVVGEGHRLLRAPLRRLPRRHARSSSPRGSSARATGAASRASPSSCSSPARSPSTGSAATRWPTSSAGAPRARGRHELELPPLLAQPQHRRGRGHRHPDAGRPPDRAAHEQLPVARRAARHPLVSTRPLPDVRGGGATARRPARTESSPCRCTARPAPALPAHVVDAVAEALGRPMQTPPARGLAPLREALAGELERTTGRTVDPDTEILVTNGAMQALGVCFRSLVEPGDEVVVPAPCFFFEGPIRAAGGSPRLRALALRPTAGAGTSTRSRRRSARGHGPCSSAIRATRPATSRRATDVAAVVAAGGAARAARRHRRGVRGVALGRRDARLGLRPGRGRGRDPQPGQEPCAAAAADRLPGRAARTCRGVRPHARVGLPAGRRRGAGGGARRARRGREAGSRRSTRSMAADREVALEAVEATPGLSTVAPRAAPFLFVGVRSRRRARRPAAGSRPAGRRRRFFQAPGYARLPFGGAAAARAALVGGARPRGQSCTRRESARDPAPDGCADRRQQPLGGRAGTVPVRAPLDAPRPRPLAAGGGARDGPRLRAAAADRRSRQARRPTTPTPAG